MNIKNEGLRCAWAWYVCAAILACAVSARADDAGAAVIKSAKWRVPTGSYKVNALAAVPGGGPIIAVVENGVSALDRTTGKALWTVEGGGYTLVGAGEKAILLAKLTGDRTQRKLIGLSSKDGSVAYEIPLPQDVSFGPEENVHVMGRSVLVQSSQEVAGAVPPAGVARAPAAAGRPGVGGPTGRSVAGPRAPVLTAYDVDTGKELWKNSYPDNTNRVRVTFDPLIELTTSMGIKMLDPATGEAKWEYRPVPARRTSFDAHNDARSNEGVWHFLEQQGEPPGEALVTRDAATGKILGQTKLEGVAGAPAAATDKILVMRVPRKSGTSTLGDVTRTVDLTDTEKKDTLTAVNVQTGKVVWTAAVTVDSPSTRMRVAGDVLLAGDSQTRVLLSPFGIWTMTALDLATGKPLWSEKFYSDFAVQKDLLVFAANEAWVGVNRRDGKHFWSIPSDEFLQRRRCPPLIADGVLYLAVRPTDNAAASGVFAIPLEGNAALEGKKP